MCDRILLVYLHTQSSIMKFFLTVAFSCINILFLNSVYAQSPVTTSWNSQNGLGSDIAYTVFVDSRGFVWVGTDGAGVGMFDGQNIKMFNQKDGLCGNTILAIKEDKEGKMWFGSQGYGLSVFDGKKFTNYTAEDSVGISPNDAVMSLHCADNGDIYVGTFRNGVLKFNNGNFVSITDTSLSPMSVWHFIEQEKSGVIYFSTTSHGLGKMEKDVVTFLPEESGIPKRMSLGLAFDLNGDILLGTSQGLYRIRDEKVIHHYDETNGFYPTATTNDIRSLYVRKNGQILTGFYSNFWVMENEQLTKNYKNGNLGSAPTYITETKNEDVWMSTEANGLVNYKKNGIYTASNPNYGESFFVTSQNADSTIYMASEKGVYYLKKGRVKTLIEFGTFKMNDATEIVVMDTSHVLLFSMDHGVISCIEKNEKWTYEHASKVQMYFVHQLSDSLYCGTAGGSSLYTFNVYTYETKEIFSAFTDSYQLGLIYAVDVHPVTKHIWLGTYDTRTIIELTGTDTIVYTEKQGIPGGALFDFAFDQNGVCWFLNADGAFGYLDVDHFVSFESFLVTAYDGLAFDNKGNLWMGNSFGAMFVELENYQIKSWRQFNKYDGIPEVRGLIGNVYTLKDGRIMISKFDDACYIINPDEIKPDLEKPAIYLKGVYGKDHAELDSMWYQGTEGFFHVPLQLELPYDQNNITIDLGAVYFSQPDSLRFAYILEGFNETWSEYQKTATVTFTNLPNDEYVFKCKALGANGNESEILSFGFTVKTPWFKTWLFYVFIVILFVGLIYLFVKWRLSKLEKDKLKLQAIVDERTKEVVLEKEKVEEKNREILDSITYAKRIQAAIMPPTKLVKEFLKDSFIIYQPKDIVAGDFYWMHTSAENNDQIIFAAADCTGHGVPGAMVSVVCNNGLNRSVREYGIVDPGKILDKTKEIVIGEFEKSEDQVKDGMDISLCSLNTKTNELKWAGANNPLWIIQSRNGETTLKEIKPDKQPIGKYANSKSFTTHSLNLEKGDLIYLFTDGFQDQFGGEKGKKFKASSFKTLLLNIHHLTMSEQEELILASFEKWKGSFEQLDDICIIGVRIV